MTYYSRSIYGGGWNDHYELKEINGKLTAFMNGQELEDDPRSPNWGKPKKDENDNKRSL